jgi:uncharacterized DUF497 family protein
VYINWNPSKAKTNELKHGICFTDVEAVFYDEYAICIEDPDAVGERRFITIARDSLGRIVVAVYKYEDVSIRIISARKASKSECRAYEKGIRL